MCVCMHVCVCFASVRVAVRCLFIRQPCQDAVNNLVFVPSRTVLTWILAGSEPLSGSSFPPSLSSLHPSYGRHGPAKQTAVHPAT